MRLKTLIFPAIMVIGVASVAFSDHSHEIAPAYTHKEEPEVIAATFTAAWCSPCRILEPRLAGVAPKFAEEPVKFVELDFTFGERDEVAQIADREGIKGVYRRFGGASGFTLLVDRDSGEVIDMLTIDHSEKAMTAAIAQAIALAGHHPQ